MTQSAFIERPPRLQPEMPAGEVQIPDPPQEDNPPGQLLQLILLPMVSLLGVILVSVFGSGRSLLLVIPMLISLLVTSAISLHTRDRARKLEFERKAAYFQKLLELRKEMVTSHEIQLRSALHNAPGPAEAFHVAAEASAVAGSGRPAGRFGSRLWERRTGDEDFGALRFGLGSVPSRVVYNFDSTKFASDPLTRDAARLASDSLFVQDAPVSLYMRSSPQKEAFGPPKDGALEDKTKKNAIIPRHAVGVFGPRPEMVYGFIWALLAHYAAFHAPTDARLYVLGVQEGQNNWRWAGRLPHCAGDGPGQTLCFETPKDRQAGKDQNKLSLFLRGLRKTLEDRRMRLADQDSAAGADLPHLLVVVDLLTTPSGSALDDLETDPGISLLIHDGQRLGASVFFLVPIAGRVPSGCQAVIELTPDTAQPEGAVTTTSAGFRYAETGADPRRVAGRADLVGDLQSLTDFAGQLQPLHVRQTYGADLPRSLDLLDMIGAHSIEEMQSAIQVNWQRSKQSDLAAWLNASVGVMSGGDIRQMTFSSDADGVHGLIAGSTGSGKSELLSTLILSLAYNFDPTILNFVLVDFKGGAAFDPFRNLPHVVDIVTNLGGNAVERMFAAITAEIHRREAINVAAGAKHIVHYRKMGLHQAPYGQEVIIKGEKHYTAPYPHLFVFIDEFAEMIAESPEYKAQLNSITRLGRALGVHLILAAQRPTGVTDQMRANIKFRISLRVETREESGEILRRPDAAFLPTGIPGRGYLQVGNENIELIQVAWSGADFTGDQPEAQPAVIWRDRPQRKRKVVAQANDEAPKVYEVLVNLMADLARQHSLPQRKPWPDFLPADLALDTPIDAASLSAEGLNQVLERRPPAAADEKPPAVLPLDPAVSGWFNGHGRWPGASWRDTAMRPLLGLVDNPEHAEQFPLLVDFRRGHAAIFGGSGWGKTTFLRSLLAALAARLSPSELHVYILDFGGRQMGIFRDLPHLGAVINADEDERVVRLLRMLDSLLESRKTALSDAGADDLYAYNLAHPDRVLPAVLVLIDNFAEFKEGFDGLLPMLTSILRESRAYGIHFVVTADAPSALSGKLMGMFTERFALKLTDPTDYLEIVGRGARAIDDIPGRGFVQAGRQALSFQVALPLGESAGTGEDARKLAQLVQRLKDAHTTPADGRLPAPVNTLANRIQLAALLPAELQPDPLLRPILGIDDRTLVSWRFDARRDGPHMMIIAPPGGGKTSTLRTLALSLAYLYPPEQVVLALIDFQGRFVNYNGNHSLADLPHTLAVVSRPAELDAFVELLKAETARMIADKRSIVVLVDNYDTFTEESRVSRTALPQLGSLAREFGTFGLHFALAGSQDAARAMDELRKQVTNARFGLALASAELVGNLNGRPPRGVGDDLPPGRGFVVRGGKTFMVQLATPYGSSGAGVEEQPEVSLDAWVLHIQERYPDRAPLLRTLGGDEASGPAETAAGGAGAILQPPAADSPADGNGGSGAATGRAAPAALAASQSPDGSKILPNISIDVLKTRLLEAGLAPALLALLSPADMINMAGEMKLFEVENQA